MPGPEAAQSRWAAAGRLQTGRFPGQDLKGDLLHEADKMRMQAPAPQGTEV